MSCDECNYWEPTGKDMGECRFAPPTPEHGWPRTEAAAWCGSFLLADVGVPGRTIPADGWVLWVFEDGRCQGEPVDLVRVIGFAEERRPHDGATRYEPIVPHTWRHDGQTFSSIGPASEVFDNNGGQRWVLLYEGDDHAPPQRPPGLSVVPR